MYGAVRLLRLTITEQCEIGCVKTVKTKKTFITKRQLIRILIIEALFLMILWLHNYYLQRSVSQGEFGIFDWVYIRILFPSQYLLCAWLLSSPIAFIVMEFSQKLNDVWRKLILLVFVPMIAFIMSKYAFKLVGILICMSVLGAFISGITAILIDDRQEKNGFD